MTHAVVGIQLMILPIQRIYELLGSQYYLVII
jgi:hypothetical protein